MARIKTFNEIVATMIERLRLTQPNLDTKPGTVARDLFIDLQADELQKIYNLISVISEKQSFLTSSGRDLDRLAANFGLSRKVGSRSSGIVVFTVDNLDTEVTIPDGTTVLSKNGVVFFTVGTYILLPSDRARLQANAFRLRDGLSTAGVTDDYAIEVPVQAKNPGTSGNISSFNIVESNSEFGLNVTNISSFSGGLDLESDGSFRSRIVSVFSGANIGTSSGYKNAADGVSGVIDSLVVEPGNSLMLRDGTEVLELDDGSYKIVNSGTGGKVDIYILGRQLEEITESFIFNDSTDGSNISDDKNDLILGNSEYSNDLTSEEKRFLAFKSGNLPKQPVVSVNSVTGSLSGLLAEATLSSETGMYDGNYRLVKDLNPSTGGSPFGKDRIKFVSLEKEVSQESKNKKALNSSESLSFQNNSNIKSVYQDIIIDQELGEISPSDNSIVGLSHSPVVQVSQVVNITTGESYFVEQDGFEDNINSTGEIKISGNLLPRKNDKLRVDYTWRLYFDKYLDYNPSYFSFFKEVPEYDYVEWKNSNSISGEESLLLRDSEDSDFYINTEFNITNVYGVYVFSTSESAVFADEKGVYCETDSSTSPIKDIVSIVNQHGVELFNTPAMDGNFKGRKIYFSSDAPVSLDDTITIKFNKVNLFETEISKGSFSLNRISLPSNDRLRVEGIFEEIEDFYLSDTPVYIDYSASIKNLVASENISSLPISNSEDSNSLFRQDSSVINDSVNVSEFYFDDSGIKIGLKRFGPSRLKASLIGLSNSGSLLVSGETVTKLELQFEAYMAVNGLEIDFEQLLSQNLEEYSEYKLSKVTDLIIGDHKAELYGYSIRKSDYEFGIAKSDSSLSNYSIRLHDTINNSKITYTSGSTCYATIYLVRENDSEELFYFSDSYKITDKIFSKIKSVSILSGLKNSLGQPVGELTLMTMNQPEINNTYNVDYSFYAPQNGERITVRYNTNRLISTVTNALESVRPVTADILVKEAEYISVDVSGDIVIDEDLIEDSQTILENVVSAVTNLLNTNALAQVIDYSDVLTVASSIDGVDSLNIKLFNVSGEIGRKSFIKSLDNQSIIAGTVSFNLVDRRRLRVY
jgi:uncharacterized phage protein gp47/JayE